MKKVAIIGGGLGGLSAAISLAANDCEVHVFEKNEHFGGKLMPIILGTHTFDFGPNTITMPQVFDQVFRDAGENPRDYFEWIPLKTHTRNISSNGEVFDMSTEMDKMMSQLQTLDPYAAQKYPEYLDEVTRLYHLAEKEFFPRTFTSMKDYLSPSLFRAFMKVRPLQNMDSFHKKFFKHPLLLQTFNRYATYIGSSPFQAPATFALIAYLEMIQGVYYVKGGNVKIAECMAQLAEKLGVRLYSSVKVERIYVKNHYAKAIKLSNGDDFEVDAVVMNGDLLEAYPKLVEEPFRPSMRNKKVESYSPSISAFVLLAGLNKRLENSLHHQVYFSKDYRKEFETLFNGIYPDDPTIYISNSSITDPSVSPDGDNLFILVNAPPIQKEQLEDQVEYERYKNLVYDRLESFGLKLRPFIVQERMITPHNIQRKFGAYRGALYGISANERKNTFLRPSNRSKDILNLYFAGGTTHPGGGSPMVIISGRNVAREVLKQWGSDPKQLS
ncbi:phytoene desaturase [Fictibacillus phosphorivorans]|uniref:4,4'-diaponeurosporene oxygenase n=1 Tax=Fictibacillus phosphorivorans TaxID=1221500 RepID=A0A163QBU5_9BACL|nr:phytoene desaturase family protein [Fictibacillus phosphorivorans]KZE64878.1 phytoene desaturase [Fictibacillus phosphorivorans]